MKSNKWMTVASASLITVLITGCDNKPAKETIPEVNDANCKHENIARIEDQSLQQKLSSLCLRRGGDFQPSPKREW